MACLFVACLNVRQVLQHLMRAQAVGLCWCRLRWRLDTC